MDCVDSFWNFGNSTFANSCPSNGKNGTRAPIDEDNFQCTFFRQPKPAFAARSDTSQQPGCENSISFNLSDTCTDSESEFDEPVNATSCSQTTATSWGSLRTLDDQISQSDAKALHAPRVTFDRTLHVHSDRTVKSCLKKRSIKEAENSLAKVARLSKKRNYLGERNDTKNRKCCVRFGATTRFPTKYEKQIALKDRVLSEERARNLRDMRSGAKRILCGTKRSYNPTNSVREDESTCKRKKLIENRIVKNKRLLKSMEEVIRGMNENEGQFQLGLASFQSIKPLNKIAETDLTKLGDHEVQGQRAKKITNRRPAETEIRRPIFKKPELEKMLDESMRKAVKKYRACGNTWDDGTKEKFVGTRDGEIKRSVYSEP